MRRPKPYHYMNVKIAEPLINIIDLNLKNGNALRAQQFKSRVDFVETALVGKLLELNLLDQKAADELKNRRLKKNTKRKLALK